MESDIKEKIIELINDYINPGLASHAGHVELKGAQLCEDNWEVTLDFMGGCHGCPSSLGSTLKSIESFLREELNAPTLLVKNSTTL